MTCPICDKAERVKEIYSSPYNSKGIKHYLTQFYMDQGSCDLSQVEPYQFELMKCQECELIYQKSVPNGEMLFELYEKWIDPVRALERDNNHLLDYRWQRMEETIQLIDHFDPLNPKELKVLDFGMGWGSLLHMFKSFGVEVYGLELSEARIKEGLKKGITVLKPEELELHDFDIIVLNDVLEHLTDPLEVLKSLVERLKPNGVMKLSVPNQDVFKKALNEMDWYAPRGTELNLNGISPLEHLNLFSEKSLLAISEKAGLKAINLNTSVKLKHNRIDKLKGIRSLYRKYFRGIRNTDLYFAKS